MTPDTLTAILAECDAIEADYDDQHDETAVGARAAIIRIRTRIESSEPDTLAEWLHQRFCGIPAWDLLSESDKTYWVHQAQAVRRAVARNGFKKCICGEPQTAGTVHRVDKPCFTAEDAIPVPTQPATPPDITQDMGSISGPWLRMGDE